MSNPSEALIDGFAGHSAGYNVDALLIDEDPVESCCSEERLVRRGVENGDRRLSRTPLRERERSEGSYRRAFAAYPPAASLIEP